MRAVCVASTTFASVSLSAAMTSLARSSRMAAVVGREVEDPRVAPRARHEAHRQALAEARGQQHLGDRREVARVAREVAHAHRAPRAVHAELPSARPRRSGPASGRAGRPRSPGWRASSDAARPGPSASAGRRRTGRCPATPRAPAPRGPPGAVRPRPPARRGSARRPPRELQNPWATFAHLGRERLGDPLLEQRLDARPVVVDDREHRDVAQPGPVGAPRVLAQDTLEGRRRRPRSRAASARSARPS